MRRIALTLFFALGFLFFVGCDVYRQIPVQYNSPTVVSKEPSIIVSKDPSISVSALQWNYSRIRMNFVLPDDVLISPGEMVINGKPQGSEWKYYPQYAKMIRKEHQVTEPFTTSSEAIGRERIRNILTLEFSYTSRPKKPETIQIDLSKHITLEGKPVFSEPIILSL